MVVFRVLLIGNRICPVNLILQQFQRACLLVPFSSPITCISIAVPSENLQNSYLWIKNITKFKITENSVFTTSEKKNYLEMGELLMCHGFCLTFFTIMKSVTSLWGGVLKSQPDQEGIQNSDIWSNIIKWFVLMSSPKLCAWNNGYSVLLVGCNLHMYLFN